MKRPSFARHFSDVVDGPAVFGVAAEPVIRQEVTEVRRPSCGCQMEWMLLEDVRMPRPRFQAAVFRTGDDAQQDRGAVAARFAAHEEWEIGLLFSHTFDSRAHGDF